MPTVRLAALCVGAASLVTGMVAVFVSGNQAGTAALIVVSAPFLLLALCGAPPFRPDVDRVLARLAAEPNPDVARGALDALALLSPAAAPALAAHEERLYAARVREALTASGASVEERIDATDLIAQRDSARPVLVVVTYVPKGPLYRRDVDAAHARLRGQSTMGLLVVTNAPLSAEVPAHHHDDQPDRWVEVLTWSDPRDNDPLTRALARASR